MKKSFLFNIVFFLIFPNCLLAQMPTMGWEKCYGGTDEEYTYCIIQLPDHSFIVCGSARSEDGDIGFHQGGTTDLWIYHIDSVGSILWSKVLGGIGIDVAHSIIQTFDHGFLVAGTTDSNDRDVSGLHGGGPFGGFTDLWVVKTDSIGNLLWQRCIGGTYDDYANSVEQMSDSGFVVIGNAGSFDGDVINARGGGDIFVARLDKTGNLIWTKTIGGTSFEEGTFCKELTNGDILIGGHSKSTDFDIHGNHGGDVDGWHGKRDGTTGNLVWSKCYGGSGGEDFFQVLFAPDGGYYLCGETTSIDGDVSGVHGLNDFWLVKIDSIGNIEWQNCYGGSSYDRCISAMLANDGGIVMVGMTTSFDGQVSNHKPVTDGYSDYWVIKADSSGLYQWGSCLGGSADELAFSICSGLGNSYMIAGNTKSNDFDVSMNHTTYSNDAWIVNLEEPSSDIPIIKPTISEFSGCIIENKLSVIFTAQFAEQVAISMYGIQGSEVFVKKVDCRPGRNNFEFSGNFSHGLYLLLLRTNSGVVSKKIF